MSHKNHYEQRWKYPDYHSREHSHNEYDDRHHDSYTSYYPGRRYNAGLILGKILTNSKLRIILLLSLILVLAIIIFAVILIIPLIAGLIESIKAEGLKDIIQTITGFLEKLWNGAPAKS
jgi:hypothetical protein